MTAFALRALGPADETALHALHRACPIEADFHFFFDRHPDFFAWPRAVYDDHAYLGAERDGALVGAVMVAEAAGWVGDASGRWFYLGDARVAPAARGLGVAPATAAALFASRDPEVGLGVGLVKRGNAPAERATAAGRVPGFFTSRLCDYDAANLLLLVGLGRPRGVRVRRATEADVEAICAFTEHAWRGRLLAPTLAPEQLARELRGETPGLDARQVYVAERRGRLVGTLAAWDLGGCKRTHVLAYPPSARFMRLGHGALRLVARRAAPLPAPGQAFRALHAAHVAIADREPAVLRDLLRAVVADHLGSGVHMVHLGLAAGDPLARALRGWPVQHFRSTIYAFARDDARWRRVLAGAQDPLLEAAMI